MSWALGANARAEGLRYYWGHGNTGKTQGPTGERQVCTGERELALASEGACASGGVHDELLGWAARHADAGVS